MNRIWNLEFGMSAFDTDLPTVRGKKCRNPCPRIFGTYRFDFSWCVLAGSGLPGQAQLGHDSPKL